MKTKIKNAKTEYKNTCILMDMYIQYDLHNFIFDISKVQYVCFLFWVINVMYLMPQDGQCDRNI